MADFDLLVIGAGSGGVACARRAAHYGAKVAIAEAGRVGGTCVLRGCVPKKLMHLGAHFRDLFRAARGYGWRLGEPGLDFRALLEARNAEIARLNRVYLDMLESAGVRLLHGRARILAKTAQGFRVEVGGLEVSAERVLVAVGARPSLPEIPGAEHAVTSDELLEEIYPLPHRLAVVGAGYIGVELASIFRALGAEVTLVFRGEQPLRGFDHELRHELSQALGRAGIRLLAQARPERIVPVEGRFVLETSKGPVEADRVLLATGRRPTPNTAGLGLEALGVRLAEDGSIPVDAAYRTRVQGLFAVGDCSDHAGHGLDAAQHDLTPVAIAEGRAVAERLFNANPKTVKYETVPTAVFSLPQAAAVGLTQERAQALGRKVKIFRTRFRPMLETLGGGEERVFMKLVVDAEDDRVLGVHLVGGEAAEIVQGFAVALTCRATKAQFDATVALHPTAAEELVTMWRPVEA
ncbi:MAG: glutathione-disulfide reductase [Geminicoccaceae bacterium]|nr:glutathione-disulfide reductase [Geminicoccaceae bacterium]